MIAIAITKPGGPEVLQPIELPTPTPGPREVLIRVAAAGVNRPDVMQREGKYPPPPGASDIPGLEVSGTIAECGPDVERWQVGDRVCALVSGGGYAEYCIAPDVQCLPVPATLDARGGWWHSRDVLYRLDERLRARPATRRGIVSRARRVQRNRHDRHSDGAGIRRESVRDCRVTREMLGVRAPRRRARDQLQDRRLCSRPDGSDSVAAAST